MLRASVGLVQEIAPTAVNKGLLLACLTLSVFSSYHLVRTRFSVVPWAAAVGAIFYAVNPFTYQRLIAGQLYLMLGYSLLPFAGVAVLDLISKASLKNTSRAACWTAGLLFVSPHVGAITMVLAIAGCGVSVSSRFDRTKAATMIAAATLGAGAFWILPSFGRSAPGSTSLADLQAFATQPRGWGSITHAALLHGFWRNEFPGPLHSEPALFLAAALPLGACIFAGLRRLGPSRQVLFLSIAGGAALMLSVSTSLPPLRAPSRWAFNEFPGLQLFREPHKWLAVVCLVYAVGMGSGVQVLLKSGRNRMGPLLLVLFGALIALTAYPMLWGFGGRVTPSVIPGALLDARSDLTAPGRTLYLPWHEFMPYDFAQGRTIGDIAPYLFGSDVISSDDDDFLHRAAGDVLDPRKAYLGALIEQRGSLRRFGTLIAPLGIRHIVLVHAADFRAYGFLEKQKDLTPLLRSEYLSIYENRAWKDQVVVGRSLSFPNIDRLLTSPKSQKVASTALVTFPDHRSPNPPRWNFHRQSKGWLDVPQGKTVITSLSCKDGFVVDSEPPVCHLGALAAFDSSGELLRFGLDLHLVGYSISFATVLILIGTRLYTSRRTRSQ